VLGAILGGFGVSNGWNLRFPSHANPGGVVFHLRRSGLATPGPCLGPGSTQVSRSSVMNSSWFSPAGSCADAADWLYFFTDGGSWVFYFPLPSLAAEPPSTQLSFDGHWDASWAVDAPDGAGGDLPETQPVPEAFVEPGLPVSAAPAGDRPAQPGLGDGYHPATIRTPHDDN